MNARETVGEGELRAPAEAAMEVAGGAAFFRRHGLEQLFRDAEGARFHPCRRARRRRSRRAPLSP